MDTKLLAFNKNKENPKCYRCSSEKHLANSCRFKDVTCNKYHRRGHIAKACRSRPTSRDGNETAVNQISPNESINTRNSIETHNDIHSFR